MGRATRRGLLSVLMLIALLSGCSSAVPGNLLLLSISNQTTLTVTLVVNGQRVGDFPPASHEDPIDPSRLPAPPWQVTALTRSGRVLLTLEVRPGDVTHSTPDASGHSSARGAGARADLSCGRLDVWSGPPMLGPMPPDNFPPGDCDP
jgi:hypothetical protein